MLLVTPEGTRYQLGYDVAGRLTKITDAKNYTTSLSYDGINRLTSITNPLNHTVTVTYDSRNNIKTITDAKNNTSYRYYDDNGNLIRSVNALNYATRYEYDGEDRLIKVIDAKERVTKLGYDAKGRLESITNPLNFTQTLEYDAADNLLKRFDAFGKQVLALNYNAVDNPTNVTDALSQSSSFDYDELSRLTQATDPESRVTLFDYDALNRLVSSEDALEKITTQGFDADGNRDNLTDANTNQTQFDFDASGRLVKENIPTSDTTADKVKYTYDARDLLETVTNGRNQIRTFVYDAIGRIESWTDPDGMISYSYDNNGNIETVTDENGTITREYDKLNRVKKYTDAKGNVLLYDYDTVGNLEVLTYPDAKQVIYDYDNADQLVKVTDWDNRITEYGYDKNGRLISTLRPNGTQLTRSYDDAGQLKQQKDIVVATNEVISQFDFSYDKTGNIIQELVLPQPRPPQLILPTSMTYDLGNLLKTYNEQLVEFDADGNMIFGPLNGNIDSFEFDSRNRLVNAGGTVYQYDAENQRVGVDDTQYVVNSMPALSQVLVRTRGNGEVTYYVYGLGLIGETRAGNYFSYHFDLRGSTVALSAASGQVIERFQYSPYGSLMYGDSSKTPFLFNGMYGVMSDANGLYYMRARFYSPEIRRFVNRDVLLGGIDEGQTLNRFAFVTGQPVSFVDPFGLEGIPFEDDIYGPLPESAVATVVVVVAASSIPGVGEGLDFQILMSSSSTFWEKTGAGSSLILSVLTLGTSPNFGALARCSDITLNIGSGNKPIEGAINLDIASGRGIDILADILAEHLPFKAESFNKIMAEALPSPLIDRYGEHVAKNIFEVLKQGGTVVLTSRTHFNEDVRQIFLDAGFTKVTVKDGIIKAIK